ncbi:formate/nitrite transporter family protein [Spelaeicoccus albus]|uniref:Formate/nitrite transporter FocA (FNT family) n=1 Tax=Spelaeicoccus albus TaxID=1280376 RepID=A0A7Z0IIQ7_9MICO|nr:formate/nitrite transporter family protein [Spelaeicoccus albus]NYI68750.1 formate/nitrite transporter FocA (FNT family) [Spelaeicoccus albus]
MSEDRRRELGAGDEPVEEGLAVSFNRIAHEGAERLHRTVGVMFATGFAGGLEISLGVIGYLAVDVATGNQLLAGLAFSIGLIALMLAKSELFTENFLVPIIAVAAREARLRRLFKLWGSTLLANLVSGWIIMWLVVKGFPEWTSAIVHSAHTFIDGPYDLQSMALAVLGGSVITLMTRMQHGTESDVAKIVAAVAAGFLLAGLPLFHSILDSLFIFGAIHAGGDINYLQWLVWFAWTVGFNAVGGIILVTAVRIFRTKDLVRDRRRNSPRNPDSPRGPGEQTESGD